MQLGTVFPQMEIGSDPITIRDYAQAVEQLHYSSLMAYEHVLCPGASYGSSVDFSRQMFHEPLTLFAYLAAITQLEFVTGILILPQRPIALVAKQVAEVALLSGNRLHLGVGVGWNPIEYEALGVDYHHRGKIIEEQLVILRRLFEQEFFTHQGTFHHLYDVGLNPRPSHGISIWMGGASDVVLHRAARLADGWIPDLRADAAREPLEQLRLFTQQAGRDPLAMGVHARVDARMGNLDTLVQEAQAWRSLNASHLSLNTMGCGFTSIEQHLEILRRFQEALSA